MYIYRPILLMEKGHPRTNTTFLICSWSQAKRRGEKGKSINHLFFFSSIVLIGRLGVNTGLEIILRLAPVELFGQICYVVSLKKAPFFFSSRTPK